MPVNPAGNASSPSSSSPSVIDSLMTLPDTPNGLVPLKGCWWFPHSLPVSDPCLSLPSNRRPTLELPGGNCTRLLPGVVPPPPPPPGAYLLLDWLGDRPKSKAGVVLEGGVSPVWELEEARGAVLLRRREAR